MSHAQGKHLHIAHRECLQILALALGPLLSPQLHADPLGRLFFTPDCRVALELQRQLNILTPRQETGRVLRLNGVVRHSSGTGNVTRNVTSTVWINGRPQRDDDANSAIRIRLFASEPDRADFTFGNEPSVSLHVGEALSRGTPNPADALPRRQGQAGFRISPR